MNHRHSTSDCRLQQRAHDRSRTGFSFIEVLFAMMILGIGLTMMAAMLPTAAGQTQDTAEETVAAGPVGLQ